MAGTIFIDSKPKTKTLEIPAPIVYGEIEFGGYAEMDIIESYTAYGDIEFGGFAEMEREPVLGEIEFGGFANISVDGSPDTLLEATGEIEFGGFANLNVRSRFEAYGVIEFGGFAQMDVEEAETYQIQVIVDVIDDDWGNPFVD